MKVPPQIKETLLYWRFFVELKQADVDLKASQMWLKNANVHL
jgi:hypothetical protein